MGGGEVNRSQVAKRQLTHRFSSSRWLMFHFHPHRVAEGKQELKEELPPGTFFSSYNIYGLNV